MPGLLSGALSASPSAVVDLSKNGTVDWVHWGLHTAGSGDRKASGGSRIRCVRSQKGASLAREASGPVRFRWSDGRPTVAAATASGIRSGAGFTLSAPAGTGLRTLTLYVAVDSCEGALTAHLSDNSAPDYTEIALTEVRGPASGVFTLKYRAAAPGQTLTVDWKNTNAYGVRGVVTLQAATLH